MNKRTYIKMTQPFRDYPKLAKSVHIVNQILTGCVVLGYAGLLLYLLWQKDSLLYRSIVVPLDGFLIVSVFRCIVNRKRPYERFQMKAGIKKNTKGKSFPSRHVYSAGVIAFTFLIRGEASLQVLGGCLLGITFLLAALRVWTGVHYISDVSAAMAAALLTGWIGFIVIR